MKNVDVLKIEVQKCIDELIDERRSEIMIMRLEVVNRFLNLDEIYKENNKLHKYLWSKYTTDEKRYYSHDELDDDDKQRKDEMNYIMRNAFKKRRRTEIRIDKVFKELNFRKEHMSMFVMYIK